MDEDGHWSGADARLWFLGDYLDRGPEGIAVIDLIMRLQIEAAMVGGEVTALLGNHEVQLLAAERFPDASCRGPGGTFARAWVHNGGKEQDRSLVTEEHLAWLSQLPVMAAAGDTLLLHADSMMYPRYGTSMTDVVQEVRGLLTTGGPSDFDRLIEDFAEREAFADRNSGSEHADRVLDMYGGRQLIHGHTPISRLTGQAPSTVTEPFLYAGGRCVDVDSGMYLGGPGFLAPLCPVL